MAKIDVKRLVRKHGALVSAVTAALITIFVFVADLSSRLISFVDPVFAYAPLSEEMLRTYFPGPVGHAALLAIPFGVGYFVSLWLVAPIAAELRIGHVITRSVLATGIGGTLLFVALAVDGLVVALSGQVWGWDAVGYQLGSALGEALRSLIALLPLGVLAGVLLWLWRKDHPPKHPLAGYIDEI